MLIDICVKFFLFFFFLASGSSSFKPECLYSSTHVDSLIILPIQLLRKIYSVPTKNKNRKLLNSVAVKECLSNGVEQSNAICIYRKTTWLMISIVAKAI